MIKNIIIGVLICTLIGAILDSGNKEDKKPAKEPNQQTQVAAKLEEQKPEETPITEEKEQEIKSLVNDIYMDKVVICEPDNNFTPDDLEEYLKNKGYSEENVKTAVNYGNNIYYVSYHFSKYINDKSIDEIKKNLLDEKWLKENNISQHAFTEEEIENGEKLYEHYKEREEKELEEELESKEEKQEEISADTKIDIFITLLTKNYEGLAKVNLDKENKVINIIPEEDLKTAINVLIATEGSEPTIRKSWDKMVKDFKDTSKKIGSEIDPDYAFSILNPNNLDNTLLLVKNGTIVYNVVDEYN